MDRLKRFILAFFLVTLVLSSIPLTNAITVDLYNACDDANEWDEGIDINLTVDTTIFAEGTSSIKIDNPTNTTSREWAWLYNFNTTRNGVYAGFWLRMDLDTATTVYTGFNSSDGGYMYIRSYRVGSTREFKVVYNDGVTSWQGSNTNWEVDTWYWIELYTMDSGASSWKNGTQWKTGSASDNIEFDWFFVHCYPTGTGTVWIDLVRYADEEEFPPTPSEYIIGVKTHTLGGSELGLPFRWDGTTYNSPQNFSCTPNEIYTAVMPVEWKYNATHYANFLNWSDGSELLTRSFNATSNQQYTVYYELELKYNWGGWVNFFIGLFGIALMFSSWVILKFKWSDGEYAMALGYWFVMLIIGFGFFLVWFG